MISSRSRDSVKFHGLNNTREKACTCEEDAVPGTKIKVLSIDTGMLFLTPTAPEKAKRLGQESLSFNNYRFVR